MIFLFGIILSLGFINSYATSSVQFTQYQPSPGFGFDSSLDFDDSMCEEGQDFLIQIAPFGCTPAVVRSDLLEEQNVPVFCQLAATKINPLIDVEAIESLSFSGDYPSEVAGIGFEPYRSALGGDGDLDSPTILENIGYAVIVLKQQPSEAEMPDYVEGTLGIKIKYDIKNAYGIGKTNFYLPVLTDEEWEERKTQYSFWRGRGYLRAEGIESNQAKIGLYDGSNRRVTSVVLEKGKTSEKIYLPGFYCMSSLELKLSDLEAPDTRARLRIDNDYVEVKDGERFLDDRCVVTDVYEAGILDRVTFSCKEGGTFGSTSHVLSIVPKLKLSINNEEGEYSVGDLLYDYKEEGTARMYYVYLAYAGTKKNTGQKEDLEIAVISIPEESKPEGDRLDDSSLKYVARLSRAYGKEATKGTYNLVNALREAGQLLTGVASHLFTSLVTGKSVTWISYDGTVDVWSEGSSALGKRVPYDNRLIAVRDFAEPTSIDLDVPDKDMAEARNYYDLASDDFESVLTHYPLEKTDNEKVTYGQRALEELIELNDLLQQKREVALLCEDFKEQYKDSTLPPQCETVSISNSDIASTLVTINGKTRRITLTSIYEPDLSEYSAEILIKGPSGTSEVVTLGRDRLVYLDDFRGKPGRAVGLGKVSSSVLSYVIPRELIGDELYVVYENDGWKYRIGNASWKPVSEIKNENLVTTQKQNLVLSLVGKNFEDGNRIVMAETGYSQESIELVGLDDDYAQVRVNVWSKDTVDLIADNLFSNTHTLELGKPQSFGSEYSFTLSKINLKKTARVTVIPGIENTGSQANFSFKVGIEKRGIQLSPERARNMINSLNDTIEKWEKISDRLGGVVKGLKTACLSGGLLLTLKNFIDNWGGQSIARKKVMRDKGGWYEICQGNVSRKEYSSLDECYSANSGKIDNDVELVYKLQEQQQDMIKGWQEGSTKSGGILQDDVVDTNEYMQKAIPEVKSYLESNGLHNIPDPKNPKNEVNAAQFLDYNIWKDYGTFTPEDLRDIQLNAMILNDAGSSENLRQSARKNLDSVLGTIYSASVEHKRAAELAQEYSGLAISDSVRIPEKDLKFLPYTGKTGSYFSTEVFGADTPVQLVSSLEGDFIVVLEKSAVEGEYGVKKESLLDPSGPIIVPMVYNARTLTKADKIPDLLNSVIFKRADESTYQNKGFKNPTIHFYETEPYEGLPAIVPFDTKNGWYAATKQTLPVLGGISAYDKSGRVSSFYLCHVGNNGLQEFRSGLGDDICEMINLGTGMAYNQFPGLSTSDAEKYVRCGVQAIEQASKSHGSRIIKISTSCGSVSSEVGNPAVDIPEIQCQDFMSPDDCRILYNLCDPVICPSSRCDFGGAYPVKDPIQTGIIGGLMLCLPNFPEVYVPVCLSGVKAGVDGLISVFETHRDCLQEQVDTGKTVGICDEIYSISLCELFWRQSLPLAEIAIPKLIGFLTGEENTARGGGEYLGIQSAWDSASKSLDFFTQTYAGNAFAAFKARSTEQIGSEICKSSISGTVPDMGFLDEFTEPESPVQFHARFDEIPFTTVTNPPISQYKVFYHIYAGEESSAYYKVYLKGTPGGSYYQDVSQSRLVGQGYIAAGDVVSETKDFTAPSGYKELCVSVNGQEECGFKQVTTSFAFDYVRDQYIKEQTMQTDIKTEAECISGSASAYSLLNPNIQEGVSEIVNPGVYNYGITRVCSTQNPGLGTDPSAGGNGSRWVEVGICGDAKLKCWMDTSKIKDITTFRTSEDEILSELNANTQELLRESGQYIDDKLDDEIQKIETKIQNNKTGEAVSMITELLGKVFLNKNKAELYLLRGGVYTSIAENPFKRALTRLEKERTENLLRRKAGELAGVQTLTEEEKKQLLSSFKKPEQDNIKTGICESCKTAGDNKCDEAECLAIGKFNGKNNCVFRARIGKSEGTCITINTKEIEDYGFKSRSVEDLLKLLDHLEINKLKVGNKECSWPISNRILAEALVESSNKYNIPDPLLLLSIMMQESNCDANAQGGLMGVSEDNWREYCKIYPEYDQVIGGSKNYQNNINCGALILSKKYGELKQGVTYYNNKNTKYFEWDAAIRGYDGLDDNSNREYVEEVTKRYIDLRTYLVSGTLSLPGITSLGLFDYPDKNLIVAPTTIGSFYLGIAVENMLSGMSINYSLTHEKGYVFYPFGELYPQTPDYYLDLIQGVPAGDYVIKAWIQDEEGNIINEFTQGQTFTEPIDYSEYGECKPSCDTCFGLTDGTSSCEVAPGYCSPGNQFCPLQGPSPKQAGPFPEPALRGIQQ